MKVIVKLSGIIMLSLCVAMVQAQTPWSLQQCINYAMEHNISIRQMQNSEQMAQNQYENSRLAWVPNVNVGAGNNFYLGRSMSADNTYVSSNSSNTSVSASLSLPFFSGLSIYRQTQASKYGWQASMQDLKAAQEQVSLNVMSSYLEVLFNKETVKMAKHQLEDAHAQYEKTRALFESGKVAESEVYESSAQEATYVNSVTEASNNLMLSLVSLAQLLQLEDVSNFDVVAPEQFSMGDSLVITDLQRITNYALENHPQMKAAEMRLHQSEYQLKGAYTSFIPSLNFNTGYGTGYYHYFNAPQNVKFGDQLKQNGSTYFAFQLNVPIWNMNSYSQIKNQKLALENSRLEIESAKNALSKEIQTAYYNAVAARQKYLSEQNGFKAAELAYQYAQAKYDAGRSTSFELNDSRLRYYKAESSLLQAKYQYLFSGKILEFYEGK